jgi:4-amino-4-deoxy-L-arabinose transferase
MSALLWPGVSRPALALLLLCSFTFLLGLGRQAITDSDEAYYAEAAREMVESGDWLTPHYNYADRWEKPVLYYWLTAATYVVTGTGEAGARLWSALSGVGLALLTWQAARRLGLEAGAAWLAGAIVATSFGYVSMARQALPDLPLTFCITLGIWAALTATDKSVARGPASATGGWALAGLAAGLGFLLKGPVALIVPAVVLLPVWWRERRRGLPPLSGLAVALAVFLVVGLPWYVAMWRSHGMAYLQSFFVADNLERFTTSRYNAVRSIWYYVPVVLGGLLPWSPYLALLRPPRRRSVEGDAGPPADHDWRLLLWALMPLLFYTISIGKQPRYVLPVLPPLAILIARALSARIARSSEGGHGRDGWLQWTTLATAALVMVAAALLVRAQALFVHGWPLVLWAGAGVTALGGIALAWIALSQGWRRLPLALPIIATALSLTVQLGALSGRRPEPVEETASLIHANRAAGERIGQFGVFVRSLVFYAGFAQTPIYDAAQAVSFLQSPERALLVIDEAQVPELERAVGHSLPTLGRVRYLNAGNVRARTFLRPDPEKEITTVVVVANR